MISHYLVAAATLVSIASSSAQVPRAPATPALPNLNITRTDLQRHDLSAPGREMVQARIDFEPGVFAPMHKHPGEEVIYVLKGALEYQIKGQAPVILKAGDVLFVPAQTAHSARNISSEQASELATYIVEKGKPLLVLDQ